ncbi:MAG: hypothetical protein K2G78_04370 [Muribaculaceae bacterium]|nr:hypothetical protein [Muribaculaceae bacterium]
MKKLLLINMLVLGLMSCTSNEDPIASIEDQSLSEITEKYDNYKASAQYDIEQTYKALAGSKSRSKGITSISGSELIQLLSSLSVETVDSLYRLYCTPQIEQEYDNRYDEAIDELVKQSSLEEVQQFYNFTNSYIENGGHSMVMLSESIKGRAPIIQECMIGCAASIDEYLNTLPESRAANSYCLQELTLKMAESAIQNEVVDIVGDAAVAMIGVPGADVAVALGLAGYDLYDSIKMAHEYNLCCVTHVS